MRFFPLDMYGKIENDFFNEELICYKTTILIIIYFHLSNL